MVELAREGVGHYLGLGSTYQALQFAVAALAESPDDHDLLAGAARAAWLIGAHDEAWSHVGRLLDVTAGGVSEPRLAAIGLAARIAHKRNDTEQARALTRELQTAVGELPPSEERARSMAAIAQIHMLNREPALAVEWAERAAAEAEAVGAKDVWAQAMVERGTSLTDLPERRGEGIVALIDAIGEAERVEDWVLVARGLNNLANVAPPADRRAYVERMRDAGRRAGFDHLSASNYLVRMADVAAATGDAEGDPSLTRREREVAALLAEGLNNAAVARRLFISPKTAAVHVSNILMKLGMSNRAEVAAWAVRNNV